jgi:hypothetical protein
MVHEDLSVRACEAFLLFRIIHTGPSRCQGDTGLYRPRSGKMSAHGDLAARESEETRARAGTAAGRVHNPGDVVPWAKVSRLGGEHSLRCRGKVVRMVPIMLL